MFLRWAGENNPTENLDALARQWINGHRREWKPKTTNRRITTLRKFGEWAETPTLVGYHGPTPLRALPHPIHEGKEGIIAMMEACVNDADVATIAFCGLMGLRVSEACSVMPADFDTFRMLLTVRGKGDKERAIPISDEAWLHVAPAVAAAALRGTGTVVGYKERRAREVITQRAVDAGLCKPVSSHDLRMTFGTLAYAKTNDLRATQELLGHASSKTTEGYTMVSENKMREAAAI